VSVLLETEPPGAEFNPRESCHGGHYDGQRCCFLPVHEVQHTQVGPLRNGVYSVGQVRVLHPQTQMMSSWMPSGVEVANGSAGLHRWQERVACLASTHAWPDLSLLATRFLRPL